MNVIGGQYQVGGIQLGYGNGLAGFGTAAGVNTGTSGSVLCEANANCTFSGVNAYGTPASLTLTNATGLPTAGLLNSAVTYAKIQNETANTLLGNPTGAGAAPSEITLGSTLNFSGPTLNCTTATLSQMGCGRPDGTTLTESAGVWTAVGAASTSVNAAGATSGTTVTNGNAGAILFQVNSGGVNYLTNSSGFTYSAGFLTVNGGSQSTIAAVTTASHNPELRFWDTTDGGWIEFSQGGTFHLATASASGSWTGNLINATPTGLVGIGAPSPLGTLDVENGSGTAKSCLNSGCVSTYAGACTNAANAGFVANGTTDNLAVWNAWVASLSHGVGCIHFGTGVYLFSNSAAATIGDGTHPGQLKIIGDGPDTTELRFAAAVPGVVLSYAAWENGAEIRDLAITTLDSAGSNNAGLTLAQNSSTFAQNPNSLIDNVVVRGADGYAASDYWVTGIFLNGVRWVNITNSFIVGKACNSTIAGQGCWTTTSSQGINILGTATLVPVQFNITNTTINYVATGINMNNFAQGLIVTNGAFVGDNIGIIIQGTGNDQATITGSNFNCLADGIETISNVGGLAITGNYFLVPTNGAGIFVGAGSTSQATPFNIVGNSFQSLGSAVGTGIQIGKSTAPAILTGNTPVALATGIWLQTASSGVNVQSNSYSGNTTNISNQGTGNTIGGGST